jgi:hypothetical protein
MSRVRLLRLAVGGLVILLIGGAVAAYGFYVLDWACPTGDRLVTREQVEEAFADEGLVLEPATISAPIPRGARLYRHEGDGAMVYVLVCPRICNGPDTTLMVFAPTQGPDQEDRFGVGFTNVHIWTTDADRSSEKPLRERIYQIVDEDLSPPPPDRCYIG